MKFFKLITALALNALASDASDMVSNLLVNGGFEEDLLGWFEFSGAKVSVQTEFSAEGGKAALAAGRTKSYMGIGTDVMEYISPGNIYRISAWFRLVANAPDDTAFITMMQMTESGVRSFIHIGTGKITSAEWTKVEGDFTLDVSESLTQLVLYFEGPNPGVDFFLDDVRLRDWREETKEGIEQNRMRDMRILVEDGNGAAVVGASLQIRQVRHHFAFGTAVRHTPLEENKEYRNFVEENFEWAVPEDQGQWYTNENDQRVENYTKMDYLYNFCVEKDITLRGHSVVWGLEDGGVPWWVLDLDNKVALKEALKKRISSIVGRYAGKVKHWTVNNEMLHYSYFKNQLGETIRPWIFNKTKEADPAAMSFVNEFNVVSADHTEAYKKHIQDLMNAGAQIDGIGAQGHFDLRVDPYAVRARLDSLAALNLPIWITEYDTVNPDPNARADALEKLYRTAFAHPAVGGVLMWGFYAKAHWKGANAAIVDENWTVNAAGEMYQALMEEWNTTGVVVTGTNGVADFRGYHGKYEVEIEAGVGGSSPQTSVIYLAPGIGPDHFTIVVLSVIELTIPGTLTWSEAHEYAVANGCELPTRDDLKNSGVRPERGISDDEWQPVRRVDSTEGDYVNVGTWGGNNNYISHLDEKRIGTLPSWGNTNTAAYYRSSTYMFVMGLVEGYKLDGETYANCKGIYTESDDVLFGRKIWDRKEGHRFIFWCQSEGIWKITGSQWRQDFLDGKITHCGAFIASSNGHENWYDSDWSNNNNAKTSPYFGADMFVMGLVSPVTELTITGTLTWSEAHKYAVDNGYELPTRDELKNRAVRPERGINVDEWQPVRRVDSTEGDYVNVGTWGGNNNYISHLDEERIGTLPSWGYTNTAAHYRSSTYMFVVPSF